MPTEPSPALSGLSPKSGANSAPGVVASRNLGIVALWCAILPVNLTQIIASILLALISLVVHLLARRKARWHPAAFGPIPWTGPLLAWAALVTSFLVMLDEIKYLPGLPLQLRDAVLLGESLLGLWFRFLAPLPFLGIALIRHFWTIHKTRSEFVGCGAGNASECGRPEQELASVQIDSKPTILLAPKGQALDRQIGYLLITFGVSCFLPAVLTTDGGWIGGGWVLGFQALLFSCFVWMIRPPIGILLALTNPLAILTLDGIRNGRHWARWTSILTVLLMLLWMVIVPEKAEGESLYRWPGGHMGPGYYLWVICGIWIVILSFNQNGEFKQPRQGSGKRNPR